MEGLINFYHLRKRRMKKSELSNLCLELLDTKKELAETRKEVRELIKRKQEIEDQIEKELSIEAMLK